MRTKLLSISCEQYPKGLRYFLTQEADVGRTGASYGKAGRVRISKRTAAIMLGWRLGDFGSNDFIATVVVNY